MRKGRKRQEMPAHHKLEAYLNAYIKAAGIGNKSKSMLFHSARSRTDTLTLLRALQRLDRGLFVD